MFFSGFSYGIGRGSALGSATGRKFYGYEKSDWEGRGGTARSLRCATFLFMNLLNGNGTFAQRIRVMKANQDIIHRVLQTGGRLVQLAGRFGSELAQLVAISDVSQSAKY